MFLWMDAFVSFAVAIVPISTEKEDISVVPDNKRACIGCVSGKLSDNHDMAMILGFVTMFIRSQTMVA